MKTRLEVKNIKTFNGMDGVGLNATLYFDGKKVCEVIDEGCGGDMFYRWHGDTYEKRTATEKAVEAYVATLTPKFLLDGMNAEYLKGSLEQHRADLHCPGCAGEMQEITGDSIWAGSLYCPKCNETASFHGNTLDSFVNMVVDEWETSKKLRRLCKTQTLLRQGRQGK